MYALEVDQDVSTYSYQEIVTVLREIVLSGESDLHIQAGAEPSKRNLLRKLDDLEGRIEGIPSRVVPEETVLKLAYLVCRGTPHVKRLRELETYTDRLRHLFPVTRIDLDEEFLSPAPSRDIFGGDEYEHIGTFVFQPFDVAFDVVTRDDEGFEVKGRFRVHVFRAEPVDGVGTGLCLSFRRIWPVLPSFWELGFSKAGINLISDMVNGGINSGLVLVVGATGSGKSTTVAAILEAINKDLAVNITLLEDPPEYKFQNKKARFRQIHVGRDVPTFAEGAHHALRQDPDIIVVGEIRDKETAQRALAIAKTGHLVIGTMHGSTNAPAALAKFLQMVNFDHNALGHHMQAIIAQKILEPREGYTNGHAVLPILIQEVIRPQKNKGIRKLLQSRCENPFEYYKLIGRENTTNLIIEETFEQALERAVRTGQITLETARKASERDEDALVNSPDIPRKTSRHSGKHHISDFLQNRGRENER